MEENDNENLEDEIEEILRQKGEEPGKASKPSQGALASVLRTISRMPTWVFLALPLLIGGSIVTFRVLGPAAFRLAIVSGIIFLISFVLRNAIYMLFSKRNRS
jgi:hypothetical protein